MDIAPRIMTLHLFAQVRGNIKKKGPKMYTQMHIHISMPGILNYRKEYFISKVNVMKSCDSSFMIYHNTN